MGVKPDICYCLSRFIIVQLVTEMTCHVLALKLVFIKCFLYHGSGLCGYKAKGNVQWVAINIPDKIIVLIHDLSITQNTFYLKEQAYVVNFTLQHRLPANAEFKQAEIIFQMAVFPFLSQKLQSASSLFITALLKFFKSCRRLL